MLRLVGQHWHELVGDLSWSEAVLLKVDGRLRRLHIREHAREEVLPVDVQLH